MKKVIAVTSALILGVFSGGRLTANPLDVPQNKKIIEFSWDNPTPEYLNRNLEQIETYMPHDGVGIDIEKKLTLPNGKKTDTRYYTFTHVPYQREWYKADIEHLKKVHARAKHLKHNFLGVSASSFTGEFNLYDDEFWDIVCAKFGIFAWVAKQGGCTGIRFDLEDYGNQQIWKYRPSRDRSWNEAWEKARLRGRQWMNAIAKEYPDITIFFFYSMDLMLGEADGSPHLYERLSSNGSGLLAAFFNGIYDVLPPKAKLIDGMEAYGYAACKLKDYYEIRALRNERFPQFLCPENREKFRNQASLACAAYMLTYYDGRWDKIMKEENLTPVQFFRRNFVLAVQYSDEYAWTWSDSRKWIPVPFPYVWQEKTLQNQPSVPTPYMGMALPGIEEAVHYARNPWQYAISRLQNGSFHNLIKNPGFDHPETVKGSAAVPDSVSFKELQPWQIWQGKKSKGTFALAKGKGMNNSNALLVKGVTQGCVLQRVKVNPCGSYVVRACAKTTGKCGISLIIQWGDKKGKWCAGLMNVSAPFDEDLGDGWKRATLVLRNIPENAVSLAPLLYSYASGPEDAALFDNVEVFNIFEKEPEVAPHLREAMEQWKKNKLMKQAAAVKNEKKSPSVPGNKVNNGNFQKRREVISDYTLPEGALFKLSCEAYPRKGPRQPRFFCVVGKGAGYADDSAGAIVGGNGCMVFHVTGVKPGQKYRVRAKAKVTGSGNPVLEIYWSSKRVKGPFDSKLGIPKFAFSQKGENGWLTAEGEITVPAEATKFALLPSVSGIKGEKDRVFFDDLEAVLIP